ncbi:MAG: phosphopantetheine adenylyltransferase [Candidatus Nezhaarchaeota archaeon]|nr:phosphopantetheine adenylyltransferase [Candidatus Nezhaarchaeota archaeon]MCX8142051.1 phosphopantetheine adenylyltransferase [Candidatus Nezhaarchaeota archaeon]MDW8050168.1 phosphopantetheine adenylyltransferase [Nitrososphaerota archaeon]
MGSADVKVKPFSLIAVGGTFDRLHRGHKELLRTAFKVGEKVIIGLTSDEMVARTKGNASISKFEDRKKGLEEWIEKEGLAKEADHEIVLINDVYGTAIYDNRLEALVVSEETYQRAITINKIRIERGLKPLIIIVMPMVLARDGKPISSTRIRRGEIDEEGELLLKSVKANLRSP